MTYLKNVNGITYPVAKNAIEAKRLFTLNYESIHVFLGNIYKGVAHDLKQFNKLHKHKFSFEK